MSFVDGFENCAYGRSTDILANWPLSDPGITRMIAPGKDGGKALSLVAETSGGGPIRRGVGGPMAGRARVVRLGFTVFLTPNNSGHRGETDDTGHVLFGLRVAAEKRELAADPYTRLAGQIRCYNIGTASYDSFAEEPDGSQVIEVLQNYIYRQLTMSCGVNRDGNLKIIRGDYLETPGGAEPAVLVSDKRVPFNRWVQLEFEVDMGTFIVPGYVKVHMDHEMIIDEPASFIMEANTEFLGHTQSGDGSVPDPNSANGCTVFNADSRGFHDVEIYEGHAGGCLLDDFYLFADPPVTVGVPLGDLRAVPVAIDGDGATSESVIGGTAPEATRWESVVTDDDDVTQVEFPDMHREDLYTHAALGAGPTVRGFIVSATVGKSDDGPAEIALRADDGSTEVDVAVVPVVNEAFTQVAATYWETPSAGPLDVTEFNNLSVGIRRTE